MADFFTNGVGASGALVGTERFPADQAGGSSVSVLGSQIASYVIGQIETLPVAKYGAAANTVGFTATGGQVAGARLVVLDLTGVLAAGAALTIPTAAQIVAAIPKATVGETYVLRFINNSTGAFAWTITGNSSVTVNGTATVAQNTWREFQVTLVSLVAVSMQNVGSGGN